MASQLQRRTLQQALFDVQKKRNEVNKQLDVVSRADDSFLSLITKEHENGLFLKGRIHFLNPVSSGRGPAGIAAS